MKLTVTKKIHVCFLLIYAAIGYMKLIANYMSHFFFRFGDPNSSEKNAQSEVEM